MISLSLAIYNLESAIEERKKERKKEREKNKERKNNIVLCPFLLLFLIQAGTVFTSFPWLTNLPFKYVNKLGPDLKNKGCQFQIFVADVLLSTLSEWYCCSVSLGSV